jgi:hypothetical protein
VWSEGLGRLWVNAVIQPGGFLQVAVLVHNHSSTSPDGFDPVPGLVWNQSSVGGLAPNTCVDPWAKDGAFDSTRVEVTWPAVSKSSIASQMQSLPYAPIAPFSSPLHGATPRSMDGGGDGDMGGGLQAVAGKIVKLQWRLSGASLYSFWVSNSSCGESRGYLAAGGPGSVKGQDFGGSC